LEPVMSSQLLALGSQTFWVGQTVARLQ
jgi:hypothetical protein